MSNEQIEATLSALILSIGSSAAMAMGLAPHPGSGQVEIDRKVARFNIDLLRVLQVKTKDNLSKEEGDLLESMLADLQMKFVQSQNS